MRKFEKVYCLDTNIILANAFNVVTLSDEGRNLIVLPETVLDEIDKFKSGMDEINFQARQFARLLFDTKIENRRDISINLDNKESNLTIIETSVNEVIIYIISKENYYADKENISSSIINDRKILEVTKDIKSIEEYKDIKFISLDVMARTRAISLGIETEALNFGKTDVDSDKDFHSTLHIADFEGDVSLIPEQDYFISSVEVTNDKGNHFIYYKSRVGWKVIPEGNPLRLPVPPINAKQKIMSSVIMDGTDVSVITGSAGCSLPGSLVNIEGIIKMVPSEVIKDKLNFSDRELKKMRDNNFIEYTEGENKSFMYNENSINYALIKTINRRGAKRTLDKDNEFNSKYLKLEYWLGFNDIEYSLKKVRKLRKYKKYFEQLDIKYHKNFNPDNFQKTLMHIQSLLINNDFNKLSDLPYFEKNCSQINYNYWKSRGWNLEDSHKFAINNQKGKQCTTE